MTANNASVETDATSPQAFVQSASRVWRPDLDEGWYALRRVIRLMFAYRARLALAIVFTIAAALFQLSLPLLIGQAVDVAQTLAQASASGEAASSDAGGAGRLLGWLALGLLFASALRGGFTMAGNYLAESIGERVSRRLRLAYYDHLQRHDFAFHDQVASGDLITRGMLDVEGVRIFANNGLVRGVYFLLLLGIGCALLMSTDLILGALALSFVPFAAWRSIVSARKLRRGWLMLQDRMSILTRVMEESLRGMRLVRAEGARDHEMEKFDVASAETLRLGKLRVSIRVINGAMITFGYFLSMGLVLWYGGTAAIAGEMTVGRVAEVLAFMTVLQLPVRQLGMVVNAYARAATAGARLYQVLDLPPRVVNAPGARPLKINQGRMAFENVSFSYPGGGAGPAIRGVSFDIGPGRIVGVVGPPASGKSTIASLAPRFYDVTDGRITIDGQDIREVTLESLREAVGVVSQSPFLFMAPVDHNIAYGDPWATDDAIAGAAGTAQIRRHLESLPRGFDTPVGEQGVSLSGGQKQRMSIARSALLRPRFLVFDDSASAMDADTDRRIRNAIRSDLSHAGVIVIGHRLSAVADADEILVLDRGRVIERGDHRSLISQDGFYRALNDLQTRDGTGATNTEGQPS